MTLVPNRLRPLSGNNLFVLLSLLVCLSLACGSSRTGFMEVGNYKVLLDTLPDRTEIMGEKEKVDTSHQDREEDLGLPIQKPDKRRDTASQEIREWVFSILLPAKSEIIGEESFVINSEQLRLLNFYIGCRMAMDSLQSLGARVKVQAFDVENQKTQLKQLLRDKKLDSADVVIGLTKSNHYEMLVHSLLKDDSLSSDDLPWIISPWNNNTSLASKYNRLVYLRPDAKVFAHRMYEYATKHYSENDVFIVHSSLPGENIFMDHFKELVQAKANAQDVSCPKIIDISQNFDELTLCLSKVDSALIIYPLYTQVNQAFKLLNHLSNRKEIEKVAVMGMPSWKDYDWGNYSLWDQFQIILPLVGYTQDYERRKAAFLKKYFSLTGSTDYEEALYGHDVLLFAYSVFEKYGKEAFSRIFEDRQLQSEFGFELMQIGKKSEDSSGEKISFDYLQNWNIKFQQIKEYSMDVVE
jgi:hypothetical protein